MMINFVKEGQPVPNKEKITKSILDEAKEWEVTVDLKKKLVFPNVIQTTLRPDIVLSSMISKAIVMIELTVPWETRCDEAHERKKAKYTNYKIAKPNEGIAGCSQWK